MYLQVFYEAQVADQALLCVCGYCQLSSAFPPLCGNGRLKLWRHLDPVNPRPSTSAARQRVPAARVGGKQRAIAENQATPVHTSSVVGCWLVLLAVSGRQEQSQHTKGDVSSLVKVAQGLCIAFSFKSSLTYLWRSSWLSCVHVCM